MHEYSDRHPDSHEIPGVGPSGVEIPTDAQRELAKLDMVELQARMTRTLDEIKELTTRLRTGSESYEQSHIEETIMELENEATAIRDRIRELRGEIAVAEEQGPPLPPFEQMVKIWEKQVWARYYRKGEIIGDERIEALADQLGLDEDEMSQAFITARANVDSLQQSGGDVMDDLMGRIGELPGSGEEEK